jgi:hypothetical protein
MDAAGIDLQVLSHTTPGVQNLADAERAIAPTCTSPPAACSRSRRCCAP